MGYHKYEMLQKRTNLTMPNIIIYGDGVSKLFKFFNNTVKN